MLKSVKNYALIVLLSVIFLNQFFVAKAETFNVKIKEIQGEINRDNLNEAIEKIKEISTSNENQQEQINILFGDIYLKINQPKKAEEFYQKSFFPLIKTLKLYLLLDLQKLDCSKENWTML